MILKDLWERISQKRSYNPKSRLPCTRNASLEKQKTKNTKNTHNYFGIAAEHSFLRRPQYLTTLPAFSASQSMLLASRASSGASNVINMRPRPPASRPQAAGRPWPSRNIGYGHFFKGVFSENTLYTFSRFQEFDKILYICIFGVRFRSRDPCFRTPTIRYLSFGRGVTP